MPLPSSILTSFHLSFYRFLSSSVYRIMCIYIDTFSMLPSAPTRLCTRRSTSDPT
ncbi:hypothetical protein GYMLUDRAFT_915313 [Collybiopsis luxurians FD-317 M1]|nr:hypothetical protein GYMLUDRAFT_915313 [Collybiopsis luxurians FD-317 M1]